MTESPAPIQTPRTLRRLTLSGPLILLAMLVGTLALWDAVLEREQAQQASARHAHAQGLAARLDARLEERVAALARMAGRWEVAGGMPRHAWEADATEHLADMPGLVSMQWLDVTGTVRWAVPAAGSEQLIGSRPNRDPVRLRALDDARHQRAAVLSPPVQLLQGGAGVLIFQPVFARGRFDGFLVSVNRLDALTRGLVGPEVGEWPAALIYAGKVAYGSDKVEHASASLAPLAVGDGRWELAVGARSSAAVQAPLSLFVLAAGLGGTLLIAAVLWFWRAALLRASDSAQLAQIVARTTNAVILTDALGRVEWVNEGFTRITGYRLEEVRGKKPGALLQGRDTDPATVARMHACLSSGEGFREEILNYHRSGTPYWLEIEVQPMHADDGQLTGFMAIESDITARKQAELAAAEQLHFLEQLLEVIPSPIYFKDAQGRYLGFNRAFETFFGVARADLLGNTVLDLYRNSPDAARFHWDKDLQLLREEGSQSFEATVPTASGPRDTIYSKAVFYREGRVAGLIGLISDVTDRKRAEEELRMNEAKFRSLYELAPLGIALNRMSDGQFLEGNRALFAMTGYSAEEFIRLSYWDITPREYEAEEARQLERLKTEGRYGPYEKEYIHKTGQRFPVQLSGVRLTDPQGQEVIWSVVEDITERKRAEQALRETQNFLSTIIDCMPVMLFVKEAAGLRFVMFNRAGEELLGINRDDLLGKCDHDLFPEDQADFFVARDREVLARGKRIEIAEEPVDTPHGTRLLHTIKVPVNDAAGRPAYLLGISTDITESKKVERLKSEFISTVSHELRTPLTSIRGALGLLAGGVAGGWRACWATARGSCWTSRSRTASASPSSSTTSWTSRRSSPAR